MSGSEFLSKIAIGFFAAIILVGVGLTPSVGQNNPFGNQPVTPASQGSSSSVVGGAVYTVDRNMVDVRTGPGVSYPRLDTIPRGRQGRYISERDGWLQLDFGNGLRGWVRNDLVKAAQATVSAPPPQVAETTRSVQPTPTTTPVADAAVIARLAKSFDRWDRHLGQTMLNYDNYPWHWRLARASRAFKSGDFRRAYRLAQASTVNPIEARYLMAKALHGMGRHREAEQLLSTLEKIFEDAAFKQVIDRLAQPYIDEPIVFKFGGFDDLKTYRRKKQTGARLGLNSGEYYERFVDINTWKWRSARAHTEFQSIAGIDCSGYVQMIQKEAYRAAGVSFPISGRTSTRGFWSGNFADSINPGHRPPPPPDIRPGDMILLDYGHSRFGHSMIYRGIDAQGNIRVHQMGGTAEETILAPEKIRYYKGTYRMKGLDRVRQILTA